MELKDAIGQKLMLAFDGKDRPSDAIIHALREYRASGITLFRTRNIDHPAQVWELTRQLQAAAQQLGLPPLLIAADQEGGQLMAVGQGTNLPGNMALGAAGSEALAYRAGEVLGLELAAMGINVNYAPSVDVNVNPLNPVVGIRSFGEDPDAVARLGAALAAGVQSQHVAATAKHFPGHGDVTGDSHYGLPAVAHDLQRLRQVELPPFRASIDAGVKLVMTAHVALPALDGENAPPATLSTRVMTGLLRGELGFDGVIITDAMDMLAIRQGEFLGEDALRAVQAGADLLLLTASVENHRVVHRALMQAAQNQTLSREILAASAGRVSALKSWLTGAPPQPDLSVVGCEQHQQVADEIAQASVTLVRDQQYLLPLRLEPGQRLVVIVPKPQNLTPADTSAFVHPALAQSLRAYHPRVEEIVVPFAPQEQDIAAVVSRLEPGDVIIVGTLNAYTEPGQAALVSALLAAGRPTLVAALRLPYDLAAFPDAPAFACTYSILEPSMRALARSLFQPAAFRGKLPVAIPGLYPAGHALALA